VHPPIITMDFLKDITKDLSVDKIRNLAEDAFNTYKPKSDVEERVYEVLSHKNWGASSSLMNDVAADTFDYEKFQTITGLMWQAMDSRPSAWRVVFKSLTLLEHLLKNGSERCVDDARNHLHKLKSLANFNYFEGTVDRGVGVREKSKQVVDLIADNDRIREEREKARALRDKFAARGAAVESSALGYSNRQFDNGYESRTNNGSSTIRAGTSSSSSGKGKMQGFGSDDAAMMNRGYAGRYSGESSTSTAGFQDKVQEDRNSNSTKIEPAKVKKTKKVKKKEENIAVTDAAVANIDLLSLDINDVPPAVPAAGDNDFDAFGNFEGSNQQGNSNGNVVFDAFGTYEAATPTIASLRKPPTTVAPSSPMDAFGDFGSAPTSVFVGGNSMYSTNNMMGMGGMLSQQPSAMISNNNFMGGPPHSHQTMMMQQQQLQQTDFASFPPTSANEDDDEDFGGFSSASAKITLPSSDPMAKLVSLDGLSKNKKKENALEQPIVFNELAAAQIQQKASSEEDPRAKSLTAELSFRGIDGLSGAATPAALASKNVPKTSKPQGVPVMQTQSNNEKAQLIAMMGEVPSTSTPGMLAQQQSGTQQPQMMPGVFQQPVAQQLMPMQMTPQMMQQMLLMQQQQAMMMGGTSVAQGGMMMSPQMMQQPMGGVAMPMGGMNPQMMMMMHNNPQMFGVAGNAGQTNNWMQGMGNSNSMGMDGSSTMGGQSNNSSTGMMGGQPMQGWH